MRIRKIFTKWYQALLSGEGGCLGNTAHHTTVSLLTSPHLSHTSLLSLLPSYLLYIHKNRQQRKTNDFFGVLNLIWDTKRGLFCFKMNNAQCSTDLKCYDNTGRLPQLSSFARWERRWASPWQLSPQRAEKPSNHPGYDYISKSHSDSRWDLSGWGSAGVWNAL